MSLLLITGLHSALKCLTSAARDGMMHFLGELAPNKLCDFEM